MELDKSQYFASYEDLEIHKLMLEDAPRTLAYKKAILGNQAFFKDKVVMDVGCGTGILSIFCAQAGAKKVYAVEASNLAHLAKEIIKDNGFEEAIDVLHSKVEDVILPENNKVDAIVSEWMGFFLLHEGMLDSVIFARDKFLKVDGQMFPENATIYVAPCSVPSLYETWNDYHGVNMNTFAQNLRLSKYNKPDILLVNPDELIANEVALCWIDLKEDKVSDSDSYSIQHVAVATKNASYEGICLWFECTFPDLTESREESPVVLYTGPHSPATHWKQTVIVLPQKQVVAEGEPVAFQLDMSRDVENTRRYNLQVTLLDPEEAEHPVPCPCHMTKCIVINAFMKTHPEKGDCENQADKESDENILIDDPISDDDDR